MSDTFRKAYRPLSDAEKKKMGDIKQKAENLLIEILDIELVKDQRCREQAIFKLEETVMWAVKAITG